MVGKIALVLSGLAEFIMIALVVYGTVTGYSESAEAFVMNGSFVFLGLAFISFLLCGGRRVWAWLTAGFRHLWFLFVIPFTLPFAFCAAIAWLAIVWMVICVLPILPVYLTYRENY